MKLNSSVRTLRDLVRTAVKHVAAVSAVAVRQRYEAPWSRAGR